MADTVQPPEEDSTGTANLFPGKNGTAQNEVGKLLSQVAASKIPPELKSSVQEALERLNRAMEHAFYEAEYESYGRYVEWLLGLPWDNRSVDNLDLEKGKQFLEQSHYGLQGIKERILEYISVLKLQSQQENSVVVKLNRSPVLCFVGMPGTGKTSLAKAIAQTLGREFIRIPMGGMTSALILRGQPKTSGEAEPGMIIRGLRRAGTKNPVILLDEIDSIGKGAESDIMGVLLELLDPEQNNAFTDYYIDYPFDLSEVLFVCSANKMGNITAAVMDRLETIILPRYTDEDKIIIARDYLFPREIKIVGLDPNLVKIADDAWPHIIKPFGYEIDIRQMERTINGILRKVAKAYVEGNLKEVTISAANLGEFLPQFI